MDEQFPAETMRILLQQGPLNRASEEIEAAETHRAEHGCKGDDCPEWRSLWESATALLRAARDVR